MGSHHAVTAAVTHGTVPASLAAVPSSSTLFAHSHAQRTLCWQHLHRVNPYGFFLRSRCATT